MNDAPLGRRARRPRRERDRARGRRRDGVSRRPWKPSRIRHDASRSCLVSALLDSPRPARSCPPTHARSHPTAAAERRHRAHVGAPPAARRPRACASSACSARSCATSSARSSRSSTRPRCFGAVWSLLNPVVFLAVFTFVIDRAAGAVIPDYPAFLLSGLLAWNLFSRLALQRRAVGDREREPGQEGLLPARNLAPRTVGVGARRLLLQSSRVLLVFFVVSGYGFRARRSGSTRSRSSPCCCHDGAHPVCLGAERRYRDVQT